MTVAEIPADETPRERLLRDIAISTC